MSEIEIANPDWLIGEKIKKLIADICSDLGVKITADQVHLEHPADPGHGDFATNIAMAMYGQLKASKSDLEAKSPFQLAELIAEKIQTVDSEILATVEAKPPGFINFWLKKDYLLKLARELDDGKKIKNKLGTIVEDKTMVIDYSSPNIAKPFGIGHLRSTNIGQAIYNLYQILGWRTIGDNHLGDWGTQFGKLIVAIKKWWKKDLDQLTIPDLLELYIKFHKEAEENSELEDEGREWFKKLEEGDKEAKKIWQFCVDISLKEFDRVYELLGVEIDEAYGEAFYHFEGWMDKVLKDVKEKGLLKTSQGAKVVEVPGQEVPAMLVKSDGATTYLTRDLATIKFRVKEWDPDLVIYEVGSPQRLHFKQVFSVAERLGYITKDKLVHVAHGLLRMETGKFSTREGKTIYLEEVLDEAIKRAKEMVEESQTSGDLSADQKEKIAQAVGIGGVKFNDLKQEPEKDIVFDWDQILSMDGYSAPYLQYTYARCSSVISKATSCQLPATSYDLNEEEYVLLRVFYQFPEVIISAAENFGPHLLCQYLFNLAQKFNLFYQKHRILEPKQGSRDFRLFLTKITASILKTGLELLGIQALEQM